MNDEETPISLMTGTICSQLAKKFLLMKTKIDSKAPEYSKEFVNHEFSYIEESIYSIVPTLFSLFNKINYIFELP